MSVLAAALLGSIVIALALQDAFEVMLLPRRVRRRVRLMRLYFDATWAVWSAPARRRSAGPSLEAWLAAYGPLSLVLLFVLWSTFLILGFGLLQWALQAAEGIGALRFGEQMYMSGATFFTLGYGDVVPRTGASRLLGIIEAGTGFGLIAVVIGYLPVLYQFFSRREAHVIRLDARAGTPPLATTLLCRHAEGGGLSGLHDLLREWEAWCSELLESHLSYPMLAYYRSQHDNQSWLAALTLILDTCALVLVGVEGVSPLQARMTFTMARQVLVELAQSFAAAPSRYTGGDRLPLDAFARLEAQLAAAGVPWQGGPDTQEALGALRATYEPLLDALASHLLLPVQGWVVMGGAIDQWEHGPRGVMARRLVEILVARTKQRTMAAGDAGDRQVRLWRRIRARLRQK